MPRESASTFTLSHKTHLISQTWCIPKIQRTLRRSYATGIHEWWEFKAVQQCHSRQKRNNNEQKLMSDVAVPVRQRYVHHHKIHATNICYETLASRVMMLTSSSQPQKNNNNSHNKTTTTTTETFTFQKLPAQRCANLSSRLSHGTTINSSSKCSTKTQQ